MAKRIVVKALNVLLVIFGLVLLTVGISVCFDPRVVNVSPFVVAAYIGWGIACLCLAVWSFIKLKRIEND